MQFGQRDEINRLQEINVFERELIEPMFLERWSIVRTLMRQTVAEHTYLVTHYVNDLCVCLGVSTDIHLAALQAAIWHDVDEQFTGDLPGPNKRALLEAAGPAGATGWKGKLKSWVAKTFQLHYRRSGGHTAHSTGTAEVVELLLKTADWLEASTRMATETQMGNRCAERHVAPNRAGAYQTAAKLVECLTGVKPVIDEVPLVPTDADRMYQMLTDHIWRAVDVALNGQSVGPWITNEDETRLKP